MKLTGEVLRREIRVAFSLKAQPIWFRVTKWIVAIAVIWSLWGTPWFWWVVGGATVFALTLPMIYRWKTQAWSRPWGGWNDLDAGR